MTAYLCIVVASVPILCMESPKISSMEIEIGMIADDSRRLSSQHIAQLTACANLATIIAFVHCIKIS